MKSKLLGKIKIIGISISGIAVNDNNTECITIQNEKNWKLLPSKPARRKATKTKTRKVGANQPRMIGFNK